MLTRLAPLEARLGAVESGLVVRDPALDAVDARLEALRERIAVLETPGESPFAAVAAQLAGLHAQKDALAEGLLTRLAALEAEMAGRDPQGALDGFAARLEALRERIAGLEAPGEIRSPRSRRSSPGSTPRRTRRPRRCSRGWRRWKPRWRGATRKARSTAARRGGGSGLRERIARAGDAGGGPFAAVAAQLAELHAQKDALAEGLLTRFAALEEPARWRPGRDTIRKARSTGSRRGWKRRRRCARRRRPGCASGSRCWRRRERTPSPRLAAQLAELHAQKDALAEGLLTRFAALEAEVAARDPQGALDGLAVRLEAAQALREAAEAGLRERVALLEAPGESPVPSSRRSSRDFTPRRTRRPRRCSRGSRRRCGGSPRWRLPGRPSPRSRSS